MPNVRVTITRYTDRSGYPWFVEAELLDADGVVWRFEDKEPIFLQDAVIPPAAGIIRCEVVDGTWPTAPDSIVTITTRFPDDVEAVGSGETEFRVRADQLVERT